MPIDYTQLKAHLWSVADELRTNSRLRSHEYSTPVLGLILLRYAGVKFSRVETSLKQQSDGGGRSRRRMVLHETPARYKVAGVPCLPKEARFETLLALPGGRWRWGNWELRMVNDEL